MTIEANDTLEFPGAATLLRPPITGDDCTNFPSFNALVLEEHAADQGCTIRSALGWCTRTVAQIETDCEAV